MEDTNVNVQGEQAETPVPETTPDYKSLYENLQSELEKSKAAVTKANGEAASYKRKLSEHLTEEENAKMQRDDALQKMQEELELLRTEKRVGSYQNRLMAAGLSAEDAGTLAKDLPAGVSDTFFDGIKKFIETRTTEIRAEALKQQPSASVGLPVSKAPEKSEFDKRLDRAFGL